MPNHFEPKVIWAIVCGVLLSVLAPQLAWSQLGSGTIAGTVTDNSGAVIPAATITLVDQDTNTTTTLKTNADGTFVAAGLAIGVYTVTATKEGFETYTQKGVEIHPTQVVTVNPQLAIGTVTQQVEVSASAAQVQTTTPEVSNEVSSKEVGTLPLNGRNFQSLSALMPGVTNMSPDTAQVQGGFIQINTMSVNGMGVTGSGYYLDGVWDIASGNMDSLGIVPNPDSIQEVRVLQNNYSAQYTLYGSTAVILQTKSGTDKFHGLALEYLRNDALDARNFFSPTVPPLKQNIFGYNLGGPIYLPGHGSGTKKTFFFWSQQWSIQHVGLQSTAGALVGADPTQAMRNGDFSALCTSGFNAGGTCNDTNPGDVQLTNPANGQPLPNNMLLPGTINSNSVALLNATAPLPNNPSGGFLNYINLNPVITNERDEEIKVDHHFSDRVRLMAEYLDDHQNSQNPNDNYLWGSPYGLSRGYVTTYNLLAQVQLTATLSPSMVNTTSLNMINYIPSLLADGTYLQTQVPNFHETLPFNGFLSDRLPQVGFAGGYASIGQSVDTPTPHASNFVPTLSDDWSWLRGKHFLQAGMAVQLGTARQNTFSASNGEWFFSGQFTGNPIADYLLGDSATFYQQSNVLRTYNHWRSYSPYFEDRWKPTRRLTLTGGLRYLYMNTPTIQKELASNFFPSDYNPANAPIVNPDGTITPTPTYSPLNGLVLNGVNGVPLNFVTTHESNWAPTAGFAYDVFGNGKTSVRGGFGLTYTSIPTGTDCGESCTGNPPIIQGLTLINAPFPSPIGAAVAPPGAASLVAMSPHFYPTTGALTYSLSVEHQFSSNWLLSVAGAANATRHAQGILNINQPLPDAPYDFNPIINTGTVFPNVYSQFLGYGNISQYTNGIRQRWNALEVNLRHPVGHNVTLTSSYTWQHCLTNSQGGAFGAGGITGSSPPQDSFHLNRQYGTCSMNVFNIWTSSLVWTLPWFQGAHGLESLALRGWQFADITTIQDGFALNPALATSNPGLATYPNRVAGSSTSGPKTVAQWFNTNAFSNPDPGYFGNADIGSIVGPGVFNFDMAFYKDFHVKERHVFQFRAELFNIFNRANFSGVSTAFGSGNFGQVTSALDPRIAEFALRYQF
jgi:hypothetical protein